MTLPPDVGPAGGDAAFRHVADAAPFPVWSLDPGGRLSWVNKRYLELTGRTLAETRGAGLAADAHEDDVAVVEATLNFAGTAHEQFTVEYRLRRVDGEFPMMLATGSPRFGTAGDFLGFLGSSTDIAARDPAAQQHADDQRLEAVQRLAAGVAHEFNNLLTQVKVASELVMAELTPTSPGRADVETISRAADRATVLARQLLAFGKRQLLRAELVDIDAELGTQLDDLRALAGAQIAIKTQLGGVTGAVRADRDQLAHVLRALVSNARDAMPAGGVVTLATTPMAATGGEIGPLPTLHTGQYVRLTVGDNGPGMDEEAKAHAFEPLFTTRDRNEHPGLGLSSVFGIVQQMGGSVWIDSGARQGTRVHLFLPLDEARSAVAPRRTSLVPQLIRRDAVLLVEDDDSVRDLACRILQRRGYRVHVARDGMEALDVWQRHKHETSVLLTDVMMPGMTGRDLVLALRQQRPRLPVVFMSGYAHESLLNVDDLDPPPLFLEKPFTVASMGDCVSEALATPEGNEGMGLLDR